MTDYDYIVSGFGCAGMSLMHYLLDSPLRDKKILLIESSSKTKNDRTWCYWAKEPLAIHPKSKPLVSWDKIKVKSGNESFTKDLDEMQYFHIKSLDFYQEALERIKAYPNVSLLTDTVTNITPNSDDTIKISTKYNGTLTAEKVFNSIPLNTLPKKDLLRQVFVGWEISSKEKIFDPTVVTLMDFVEKDEVMEFFYVLPFDSQSALIEYTAYSTESCEEEVMEKKISDYITKYYALTDYTIRHKESGSIPMSTHPFTTEKHPNIIPMGTLGGCTKPSTGYTFYDVQKHCKQLVSQLDNMETKKHHAWERQPRFKFYDNILLNIAKKWPASLPGIFNEMFKKNSAKTILNFLSEETSFAEEVQIFWKLKFGTFIKSLLHFEKH